MYIFLDESKALHKNWWKFILSWLDFSEEKIKDYLNNENKIFDKKSKWFTFAFENSKRYWWIKFADFISWKLRNTYINEKEIIDSDFIEYFVNNEISFIILE